MASRAARLKQLLTLQEQVRAFHEMRHATHLAAAEAAERDATDILARKAEEGSLVDLFPDIYARAVQNAYARRDAEREAALKEAGYVAREKLRAGAVEKSWREALRAEHRTAEEKAGLEAVERQLSNRREQDRS